MSVRREWARLSPASTRPAQLRIGSTTAWVTDTLGATASYSDFEASLLSATEIQALVAAWQSGAISRDTLLHNLRVGEILPSARTNEQELELIRKEPPPVAVASQSSPPRATMAA